MNFAEAILHIRTVLRISQQQLAAELDVSYATVNRWENGRTMPNKMTLNVIKQYCHSNNMEFNYDPDITNNEGLVYLRFARKQDTYYVNKVYPLFSVSDLRHDLINRARKMARMRTQDHPWQNMNDEEMLRSAGLILNCTTTGKEGITLAAILLFGPDNLILSVLAHVKK